MEGGWFKGKSVLQYNRVYCKRWLIWLRVLYCNRLVYIAIKGGWQQGAVYCNTLHCIAAWECNLVGLISKYTECIVIEAEGHEVGPCRETGHDTASQARGRACDTAACALRHARHVAQGRGARHAGARGTAWREAQRRGAQAGAATQQPRACDTAGPGHDTARPRATIRPLCVPGRACVRPGCAQLGQFGFFCAPDSVFGPV